MATLTATDIWAGYRRHAVLRGVELNCASGVHMILGANGVGKTTLLRVLAGILPPSRGRVLIDGRDPNTHPDVKSLVGMTAHRSALAGGLSVADNLRYWARVLALSGPGIDRRVEVALDALDLRAVADRKARTLSRGLAQRVAMARALLGDPPILLLDEPTVGVDPGTAAQMRKQLRQLADDGRIVLLSTHELADADDWVDNVIVLHDGKVAASGPPETVRGQFMGQRRRIHLRASGDLHGALVKLGYDPVENSPGDVFIEVADDAEAVEHLVEGLVREGIGIREVSPAEGTLTELYFHLHAKDTQR